MNAKFLKYGIALRSLLSVAAVFAVAGTVAGFLGRLWWPFELVASFRVQWFVILLAAALSCFLTRKYNHAILFALCSLPNMLVIAPVYFGPDFVKPVNPTVRALLINVNVFNDQYERVRNLVKETDADFIVVQEIDWQWQEALKPITKEYPFHASKPREDNFGIAMYSRTPFTDIWIGALGYPLGPPGFPTVVAQLTVHRKSLTVIGIHPPPPLFGEFRRARRDMLEALRRFVLQRKGPVMVLGDLNTTPWSPLFTDLLQHSRLRDSRKGFGIQATWPSDLPFLLIPVDHCLVSEELTIANRRVGPHIGSDHYPVIVDFSFR